jgi:hypothetical protein
LRVIKPASSAIAGYQIRQFGEGTALRVIKSARPEKAIAGLMTRPPVFFVAVWVFFFLS